MSILISFWIGSWKFFPSFSLNELISIRLTFDHIIYYGLYKNRNVEEITKKVANLAINNQREEIEVANSVLLPHTDQYGEKSGIGQSEPIRFMRRK